MQHIHYDAQAIYLDTDTLWTTVPSQLEEEILVMKANKAFFAMALETSDKNGKASWYTGGEPYNRTWF